MEIIKKLIIYLKYAENYFLLSKAIRSIKYSILFSLHYFFIPFQKNAKHLNLEKVFV